MRRAVWTFVFYVAGTLGTLASDQSSEPNAPLIRALVIGALVALVYLAFTSHVAVDKWTILAKIPGSPEPTTQQNLTTPSPLQPSPKLAFGRAEIPLHSRLLGVKLYENLEAAGRVIRVPISNAQGAPDAKQIHARLTFPQHPGHPPWRQPAQGEWSDRGSIEAEIDLPGNGAARFLDVVAVVDKEYPHGYEWTGQSRKATLWDYGIYAVPFDVQVEVMGSGSTPTLKDTLRVTCRPGDAITADWVSDTQLEHGTNWVGWNERGAR